MQDDTFWPDLDKQEANALNSNAASIALFFTIGILFFTGVIYDIVGRRKTIVTLFLVGALSTIGFPISAPS